MLKKRGPKRSSFGPTIGVPGSKLIWSVSATSAAGVHFGTQRTGGIGHEQHLAAEQLDGAHGGGHHAGP